MLEENNEVVSYYHIALSNTSILEIILTYYDEKDKQDNVDHLQIVKDSLLEENEKIKKFKQALKEKLALYQQRIRYLKVRSFIFSNYLNL